LIGCLVAALAIPALAQQPDPAPKVQVETSYVNLNQQPKFRLTVVMPMVFHFRLRNVGGDPVLQVIAVINLDTLNAHGMSLRNRVTRAAMYLDRHESLFTPLIAEPPNRLSLNYATLRDLLPARRLSYNRRLL
jgi:hypothetical protein